jgi:putative transposase
MRRLNFTEGEFYHVYNRGANKALIFQDKHDYWRFLAALYMCNSDQKIRLDNVKYRFEYDRGEPLVDIGAYCLMPNHYHLLLRERISGGISKFMQKFSGAYTMYYNERHDHAGVVFQGKFKAKHIGDDRYLQHLFSYIHLNPIELFKEVDSRLSKNISHKHKITNFENYPFSSYQDYVGESRMQSVILEKSVFPFITKNLDREVKKLSSVN